MAPCNSLGYGVVGANFIYELSKTEDVNLFEIGQIESIGHLSDVARGLSFTHCSGKNIDVNARSLRIWHQFDVHTRVGKGKHFGFPIFELNQFRPIEQRSMMACDHIITCSEWGKNIVESSIYAPVSVAPLGYDPEVFRPAEIKKHGPTIFFNCGKWEVRKGHDFLLECFSKAFTPRDDVELWMMCHNPFPQARSEEWERIYKNSKMAPRIRLIPRQQSHNNVYYIMSKVDCGIFPARAEGWNLELLELMACGKHLIATNYSGHTEFCTSESCNLIEIDQLEPAVDNVWFDGFGQWASLGENQLDQTVEYMRKIHELKQLGQLELNTAAIKQSSNFTWEESTKKLLSILKG